MSALGWLEEQVGNAERLVVAAAQRATGPAWDALRQGYGLSPSRAAAGLPVPPDEQAEVFAALRRYAEHQLSCLALEPQDAARLPAFRARLAALGAPAAPPAAPTPAAPTPAPGAPGLGGGVLGGLFANAAAGKSWEDGGGYSHHVTLRCPKCGAHQERPVDFKCRYCGASLVDPPSP